MIVKDIHTTALSIPFTDPPRWSADYNRLREILVVEIETASGITGMGYLMVLSGGLRTIQACIEELVAPVVLGRSIASVEAIWRDIWRATYWVGRMGVTVFAQSAIDIALWDAQGKQAGLPLFQLWGGAGNGDPIPAYGSGCWRGLGREGVIDNALPAALSVRTPFSRLSDGMTGFLLVLTFGAGLMMRRIVYNFG